MEENILEALERNNKWWKSDFTVEFKLRDLYVQIKRFMHTPQIIAITGLRRVGKTTIMLKLVKDMIQELNRENIVYFSFDEFKDIGLKQILKTYARLMNKDLNCTFGLETHLMLVVGQLLLKVRQISIWMTVQLQLLIQPQIPLLLMLTWIQVQHLT